MAAFDDWNGLKLFLAISEAGTLSQAARDLAVNHSTVFRRLNALETEVGGKLFERHSQGYSLTTLGETLLPIAKKIHDGFHEIERSVVGQEIQPKGLIKVTAPNNVAYRYLPRHIARFNSLYPDIHIELLASNLALNMDTRQADVALRATPNPPEHLVGRKIGEIGWGVYGSEKYFEKVSRPLHISQLTEHMFVGAGGMLHSLPGFMWLEKNVSNHIQSRCDDLLAMSYLTEYGQGLSILPDDQQRGGIERLFDFEPAGKSDLWLLTHADLRDVTRIKLFMRYLAEEFTDFAT